MPGRVAWMPCWMPCLDRHLDKMAHSSRTGFSHERLDVYRVALEFSEWVACQAGIRSNLRDQLQRASDSVVLNIAEGAGQQSKAVARRHYRIALGSAAECAAVLDLLRIQKLTTDEAGSQLVARVGAMLNRMAR